MNPLALERTYQNERHTLSLLTGPRNRLAHLLDLIDHVAAPENLPGLPAYAADLLSLLRRLIAAADFSSTPPSLSLRASRALDLLEAAVSSPPDAGTRARLVPAAPFTDGRTDGVCIPVVEEEYLLPEFTPRFASVTCLRVDVRPAPGAPADSIRVAQFSPGGDSSGMLEDILLAARSTVAAWSAVRLPGRIAAYCSHDGTATLHGASLGAGLGVALACALLRAGGHREEYTPRPDAAFTGLLERTGHLGPVEDAGLRLKIEACILARMAYLAVPESQRARAEMHLESFAPLHPRLAIIRVRTLGEIFADRRLVASRQVPGPVRAGRALWRHRRSAAAALLAVLLLIIARLAYGPLDRTPAGIRFAGSEMMIVNRAGEALQAIAVGTTTANVGSSGVNAVAALLDVDADGSPEILWGQVSEGDSAPVGTVHCRTVGEEQDRWVVELKKQATFPFNAVEGEGFGPFGLLAGDLDKDSVPELFVIARHQAYPSLLLKLDARTGDERGAYLHPGHIIAIRAADLEQDGTPEILLTGVNNSLGEAFLAVLDPRCINGHGPAEGRYQPEGMSRAQERAYLRLPKSIVHAAHPDRVRWNIGVGITVLTSSRSIRMVIREYVNDENTEHDDATYYLLFTSSLAPMMAETGDIFDLLAQRYVREGRISSLPDVTYWADYIRRIRYWTGTGWSPDLTTRSCGDTVRR
jgi:hypothetical protein